MPAQAWRLALLAIALAVAATAVGAAPVLSITTAGDATTTDSAFIVTTKTAVSGAAVTAAETSTVGPSHVAPSQKLLALGPPGGTETRTPAATTALPTAAIHDEAISKATATAIASAYPVTTQASAVPVAQAASASNSALSETRLSSEEVVDTMLPEESSGAQPASNQTDSGGILLPVNHAGIEEDNTSSIEEVDPHTGNDHETTPDVTVSTNSLSLPDNHSKNIKEADLVAKQNDAALITPAFPSLAEGSNAFVNTETVPHAEDQIHDEETIETNRNVTNETTEKVLEQPIFSHAATDAQSKADSDKKDEIADPAEDTTVYNTNHESASLNSVDMNGNNVHSKTPVQGDDSSMPILRRMAMESKAMTVQTDESIGDDAADDVMTSTGTSTSTSSSSSTTTTTTTIDDDPSVEPATINKQSNPHSVIIDESAAKADVVVEKHPKQPAASAIQQPEYTDVDPGDFTDPDEFFSASGRTWSLENVQLWETARKERTKPTPDPKLYDSFTAWAKAGNLKASKDLWDVWRKADDDRKQEESQTSKQEADQGSVKAKEQQNDEIKIVVPDLNSKGAHPPTPDIITTATPTAASPTVPTLVSAVSAGTDGTHQTTEIPSIDVWLKSIGLAKTDATEKLYQSFVEQRLASATPSKANIPVENISEPVKPVSSTSQLHYEEWLRLSDSLPSDGTFQQWKKQHNPPLILDKTIHFEDWLEATENSPSLTTLQKFEHFIDSKDAVELTEDGILASNAVGADADRELGHHYRSWVGRTGVKFSVDSLREFLQKHSSLHQDAFNGHMSYQDWLKQQHLEMSLVTFKKFAHVIKSSAAKLLAEEVTMLPKYADWLVTLGKTDAPEEYELYQNLKRLSSTISIMAETGQITLDVGVDFTFFPEFQRWARRNGLKEDLTAWYMYLYSLYETQLGNGADSSIAQPDRVSDEANAQPIHDTTAEQDQTIDKPLSPLNSNDFDPTGGRAAIDDVNTDTQKETQPDMAQVENIPADQPDTAIIDNAIDNVDNNDNTNNVVEQSTSMATTTATSDSAKDDDNNDMAVPTAESGLHFPASYILVGIVGTLIGLLFIFRSRLRSIRHARGHHSVGTDATLPTHTKSTGPSNKSIWGAIATDTRAFVSAALGRPIEPEPSSATSMHVSTAHDSALVSGAGNEPTDVHVYRHISGMQVSSGAGVSSNSSSSGPTVTATTAVLLDVADDDMVDLDSPDDLTRKSAPSRYRLADASHNNKKPGGGGMSLKRAPAGTGTPSPASATSKSLKLGAVRATSTSPTSDTPVAATPGQLVVPSTRLAAPMDTDEASQAPEDNTTAVSDTAPTSGWGDTWTDEDQW